MYYKTFDYDYDRQKLLSLFLELEYTEYLVYKNTDLSSVDKSVLPMMNVFNRELSMREYGLAELVNETGMHVNPRNNGLIMFPVQGLIKFTYTDGTSVSITKPTILSGKVTHTYAPMISPAVFFAIKIPINISYEQCCILSTNQT